MPTWKDKVKQAVTTGGTGALVLGAAASGYQALGAADDGKVFRYYIDDGSAWESGYGVYTHVGTSFARTLRDDSSTGSAISVSTSAFFYHDLTAGGARATDLAVRTIQPGGRLTLSTGVPIPTGNVTSATTVYYTPYVSDVIVLWDGNIWTPVQFSETSLALGTMTSGIGYDVFAYLSGGVLALEKNAWSNATTRLTAITVQDGRYCKSGDKTRLYVGSFYAGSTTTTQDATSGRHLFNAYNRVPRALFYTDSTASWTYTSLAWRQARGQSGAFVSVINGLAGLSIQLSISVICLTSSSVVAGQVAVGVDSTTVQATNSQGSQGVAGAGSIWAEASADFNDYVALGYHAFNYLERCSTSGQTMTWYGSAVDTNSGNGGGYTNGISGVWEC